MFSLLLKDLISDFYINTSSSSRLFKRESQFVYKILIELLSLSLKILKFPLFTGLKWLKECALKGFSHCVCKRGTKMTLYFVCITHRIISDFNNSSPPQFYVLFPILHSFIKFFLNHFPYCLISLSLGKSKVFCDWNFGYFFILTWLKIFTSSQNITPLTCRSFLIIAYLFTSLKFHVVCP